VQTKTALATSLATDTAAFCSVWSRFPADANCNDIQRLAVFERYSWSCLGLLSVQLLAFTVSRYSRGSMSLKEETVHK